MARLPQTLFLAQFTATLVMTGLIWFVQVVRYPLFAEVGAAGFPAYARDHASRTGYIVALPMLIELTTALLALAPALRPAFLPRTSAILSAALVLLLWLSTAFLQVPLHDRLAHAQDLSTIQHLVLTNWLRTALWTARAILLLSVLRQALLP